MVALLCAGARILRPWQFDPQHIPVEEEDRVQSLVLGGCRHVALAGKVTEKGRELLAAHVTRMALAVKEDESADPLDIRLFRSNAPARISHRAVRRAEAT